VARYAAYVCLDERNSGLHPDLSIEYNTTI